MKIDAFHYIQLGTVYRYLCTVLHISQLFGGLSSLITSQHMLQMSVRIVYEGFNILCFFYRGLHPVPDEEVIAMYEGCHVPLENMSDFYGKVMVISSLICDEIDTAEILKQI